MTNASVVKAPFKIVNEPFEQAILLHGYFNMDNEDNYNLYNRQFWYETDFEVFIVERQNDETFEQAILRNPLESIEGIWYGDQAILDAYEVFNITRNSYKHIEGIKLYFIIKRLD